MHQSGDSVSVLCAVPGSIFGLPAYSRDIIVSGILHLEQKPFELEPGHIDEGWPQHFEGAAIFNLQGKRLSVSDEQRRVCEQYAIAQMRVDTIIPDDDGFFIRMLRS